MKNLLYSILYVSLSLAALLFSAWTAVYFPFFDRAIMAKETNLPLKKQNSNQESTKKENVTSSVKGNPQNSKQIPPQEEKITSQSSMDQKGDSKNQIIPLAPVNSQKIATPAQGPMANTNHEETKVSQNPSDKTENKKETSTVQGALPSQKNRSMNVQSPSQTGTRAPSSLESKEENPDPTLKTQAMENQNPSVSSSQNQEISGDKKKISEEQSKAKSTPNQTNTQGLDSLIPSGLKSEVKSKVSEIYQILSEYQYDAESPQRANPFAPYQDPSNLEEQEEKKSPLTPAEMYDLSDMKLIGIRWGSGAIASKALFKSPDQVIHVLQKHDRIGSRRGVIYQLREDEVVVLNPRIDVGRDTYEPVVIPLDRWKSKSIPNNSEKLTQQGG